MSDDEMIERFRLYSERFKQASVAGEVYLDTLQYIIRLRKERDEARWRLCKVLGDIRDVWGDEIAIEKGWRFE